MNKNYKKILKSTGRFIPSNPNEIFLLDMSAVTTIKDSEFTKYNVGLTTVDTVKRTYLLMFYVPSEDMK
jgi:hypothetical protein